MTEGSLKALHDILELYAAEFWVRVLFLGVGAYFLFKLGFSELKTYMEKRQHKVIIEDIAPVMKQTKKLLEKLYNSMKSRGTGG